SLRTTVPFPTPEGPETTNSRPRDAGSGIAVLLVGELGEQRLPLLRAEPADATARGDVELLHQLAGTNLSDPGEGLEHVRDLHLPDRVVALGEDVLQVPLAGLQLRLQLGALASRLRGLGERGLAVFGTEGREGHRAAPSIGGSGP